MLDLLLGGWVWMTTAFGFEGSLLLIAYVAFGGWAIGWTVTQAYLRIRRWRRRRSVARVIQMERDRRVRQMALTGTRDVPRRGWEGDEPWQGGNRAS